MKSTSIYLQFDGDCEKAFNFYKEVFQSEILGIFRYKDIPQGEGMPIIPDNDLEKIENIGIKINDNFILMGADMLESNGMPLKPGNNFSIYLDMDTFTEAQRIFNGLSNDGIIIMPLKQAHWGATFGICTDPFGINWMIHYQENKNI